MRGGHQPRIDWTAERDAVVRAWARGALRLADAVSKSGLGKGAIVGRASRLKLREAYRRGARKRSA